MADYDETTNPWPAIRELQSIVANVTSELEEIKRRLELLEEFQVKQEGI